MVLENQSDLRLSEASANGTHYIAFKAPAAIGANVTLTLPATDGLVGQAMVTNGSGTLEWGNAGAAKGGGTDTIFFENGQTITEDYTITDGKNAGTFGPVTINSGKTITIGVGETWTVV